MEILNLNPNNQFNSMSREKFKKMLISMGLEVEDCDGKGYIIFEEDKKNKKQGDF